MEATALTSVSQPQCHILYHGQHKVLRVRFSFVVFRLFLSSLLLLLGVSDLLFSFSFVSLHSLSWFCYRNGHAIGCFHFDVAYGVVLRTCSLSLALYRRCSCATVFERAEDDKLYCSFPNCQAKNRESRISSWIITGNEKLEWMTWPTIADNIKQWAPIAHFSNRKITPNSQMTCQWFLIIVFEEIKNEIQMIRFPGVLSNTGDRIIEMSEENCWQNLWRSFHSLFNSVECEKCESKTINKRPRRWHSICIFWYRSNFQYCHVYVITSDVNMVSLATKCILIQYFDAIVMKHQPENVVRHTETHGAVGMLRYYYFTFSKIHEFRHVIWFAWQIVYEKNIDLTWIYSHSLVMRAEMQQRIQ